MFCAIVDTHADNMTIVRATWWGVSKVISGGIGKPRRVGVVRRVVSAEAKKGGKYDNGQRPTGGSCSDDVRDVMSRRTRRCGRAMQGNSTRATDC